MSNTLYDRDFYAWANEQAGLLRAGRLDGLDLENLIEEIVSLARRDKCELLNRLAMLLSHLLKWCSLATERGGSLHLFIKEHCHRLEDHLREIPA